MKKTKEKITENVVEAQEAAAQNTKLRYCVSKRNIFKRISTLFLGLAIILILLSSWGFWHNIDMMFVYLQIILPIVSCIVFIVIVNHMGEKGFTLTFIPVICAAAYIIINEAGKGAPMHSVLCVALCIVVTLSYTMALFGAMGSKLLLVPIIIIPLAYRIIGEDMDMFTKEGFALDAAFLQELAILCMICALLFIVFAMKKRDFSKKEKPIEEVLVELENHPDGDLAEEDTLQPDEQEIPCLPDADTVVIAPSGEKYE